MLAEGGKKFTLTLFAVILGGDGGSAPPESGARIAGGSVIRGLPPTRSAHRVRPAPLPPAPPERPSSCRRFLRRPTATQQSRSPSSPPVSIAPVNDAQRHRYASLPRKREEASFSPLRCSSLLLLRDLLAPRLHASHLFVNFPEDADPCPASCASGGRPLSPHYLTVRYSGGQ